MTAGRSRIVEHLAAGRLDAAADEARARSEGAPRNSGDAALLSWLATVELPPDRPMAWVGALRLGNERWEAASREVAREARRFLGRGLAKAAAAQGEPEPRPGGEPLGAVLLEADVPDEAAASLFATLAREPSDGRIALLLGNALTRLDRAEEARDHYRRAFRVAPLALDVADVEDAEVRELGALAAELGLEGDVRPWLPAIGWLEDVLPLSALDPVPGAGFGDGSRFYDLLIVHKGARSHAERRAIRHDLAAIAPGLFEALLHARKLDAVAPPAGSA